MNSKPTLRDKACLSYWFPKLVESNVLVPRTEIITTDVELWQLLEPNGVAPKNLDVFVRELLGAVDKIGGLPIFLRTGHLSGKHDWSRTCHVQIDPTNPQEDLSAILMRHVASLVEWSEMVDIMGLPTKVWAVREFLPLLSPFTAYRDMPVAREFRLFIEDGAIVCVHPYWPTKALEEGDPSTKDWFDTYSRLMTLSSQEDRALREVAWQAANVFAGDGAWSLDLAQHQDGQWYAIDMAPAEISFHWAGCKSGEKWKGER